jgi:hypothetical protein
LPFAVDDFIRLRPFAYHVTSRHNLEPLRSTRRIRTAANLIRDSNRLDLLAVRRTDEVTIETSVGRVVLKDQRPLIAANVRLAAGWSLADFVAYLNSYVYFWPGRDRGPIGPGQRLLDHYESDGPVVLRIPTGDLFGVNAAIVPEFCPFNSGAPRFNAGRPAFRGPSLFTDAERFPRAANEVVELAFRADVTLPPTTVVRAGPDWSAL